MTASAHEPSRATFLAVDAPTTRAALRRTGARPSPFATPVSASEPIAASPDLILADADPGGRFANEASGELCGALLK